MHATGGSHCPTRGPRRNVTSFSYKNLRYSRSVDVQPRFSVIRMVLNKPSLFALRAVAPLQPCNLG